MTEVALVIVPTCACCDWLSAQKKNDVTSIDSKGSAMFQGSPSEARPRLFKTYHPCVKPPITGCLGMSHFHSEEEPVTLSFIHYHLIALSPPASRVPCMQIRLKRRLLHLQVKRVKATDEIKRDHSVIGKFTKNVSIYGRSNSVSP